MNNLIKLSLKTILYSFIIILVSSLLFVGYFLIFNGSESDDGLIMFKAKYLTVKEKCDTLSLEDTDILNKSFDKIGYSGGVDYWCDLKELQFFQAKEDYVNKLNGKETFTGSLIIPSQIGKLNNIYNLSFTNIKIDGNIPFELGNIKNLVVLQIQGTGIDSLPKEIEKLEKLKILYIDKYLYKNLPEIIKEKIKNKEIIDYSYYMEDYYK